MNRKESSAAKLSAGKTGKPVARLARDPRAVGLRQPGALKGQIQIAEDFDGLPEDIAKAFGMR